MILTKQSHPIPQGIGKFVYASLFADFSSDEKDVIQELHIFEQEVNQLAEVGFHLCFMEHLGPILYAIMEKWEPEMDVENFTGFSPSPFGGVGPRPQTRGEAVALTLSVESEGSGSPADSSSRAIPKKEGADSRGGASCQPDAPVSAPSVFSLPGMETAGKAYLDELDQSPEGIKAREAFKETIQQVISTQNKKIIEEASKRAYAVGIPVDTPQDAPPEKPE